MSNALVKTKTPKGELAWVFISGEGKANLNGDPQFTANIIMDEAIPEHAEYMQSIRDFFEANRPKWCKTDPKSTGIYPLTVKDDDGNKTVVPGKFYLAFKTGITYKSGDPKVVQIFNAKAAKVSLGDQKIGNGSVGRISGAMDIYETKSPNGKTFVHAGVTLYLDAIQLLKFVPYEGSEGFDQEDVEEEGWTGADEESGFEAEPDASAGVPRL